MSIFDSFLAQLVEEDLPVETEQPPIEVFGEAVPEPEALSVQKAEPAPEEDSGENENIGGIEDLGDDEGNNTPPSSGEPEYNPNSLQNIATSSYLNYAMSVITSRALPDVRDGMKPGQRRILYAMYDDFKLTYDKQHRKSAAITGAVIGRYHPHGDTASYEAMVRMSQDWIMRIPLIDGHGNFGSIDGDSAAAARYCVTGDTRILTEKGWINAQDISEYAEGEDLDLMVYDMKGEKVKASKFFDCGPHPVRRLITKEGFELTGTDNHPVLCLSKDDTGKPFITWKLFEEIQAGDTVLIYRGGYEEDLASNEARGYLAGALVAEGWCSESRMGFNNTDKEYFDKVLEYYDRLIGGRRYVYERILPSGKTLYELDVHNLEEFKSSEFSEFVGLNSHTQKIPEFIWRSGLAEKKAFLGALFEGDGSFSFSPRNSVKACLSTRSLILAKEVQQMLLDFGIISKFSKSNVGEYKVSLSSRKAVGNFLNRIGFVAAKSRFLAEFNKLPPCRGRSADFVPYLSEWLRSGKTFTWLKRNNFDRVERFLDGDIREKIRSYTSLEEYEHFEKLTTGDFYYATVESIDRCTESVNVYSIRVDTEDHSFLGGGFVNHNTEVRLAPVFNHLMPDLKKDTVEYRPNYDNTTVEPTVLPVTLPLLLINGATGIAVGMATNIPPHNTGEVIDAAIDLIRNPTRQVDTIVKHHLKGPDFPTGGTILESDKKIAAIYSKGQGSVTVRAKWHVEKEGRKASIIITEIPYGVVKQDLVEKVAKYVVANDLPLVHDIRDESTTDMRIVLEIKSAKDENAVMAFLLKHTALESKFHINLTCLVPESDSKVIPKRLDLKEMLQHFVDFRLDVVSRRTKFEIQELKKRIHVLKGFVIVLGDTEKAVKLIMAAKSKDEARNALLQNFAVDADQAENVLNARIYRLANYEIQTLRDELAEKEKLVAELEALLLDDDAMREVLIKELRGMKKLYSTPRQTVIGEETEDFEYDEADYIEDADVVVVLSRGGWFRRQKSYTSLEGLRVRDGDEIGWAIKANTKDVVTFFTNKGKAYTCRVHQLPETTGFGDPIQSMFTFEDGEKVLSCWTFNEDSNLELVAVSTNGYALRFDLEKFLDPSTTNGRSFIKLDKKQDVVSIEKIEGEDPHVVIISYDTRCLLFDPMTISKYKGVARGVRAITLNLKDYVLAFGITVGARGGSLTVETGQGAEYEIRHTTYKVGRRGQQGTEVLKRGKFVKWNREAVEV